MALVALAEARIAEMSRSGAMAQDPYRMALGVLVAVVKATAAAGRPPVDPMDADLRAAIIAVYDKQARAERQDRLTLARTSTWRTRRTAILACCAAVCVGLAAGGAVFALGWSYGGAARIAEVCRGEALKPMEGQGVACSFWIKAPAQKVAPAGR